MSKRTSAIKGVRREQKRRTLRYGMRVDNAGVRRIQLALIDQPAKRRSQPAAIVRPR
jgi:hypothetical protein